MFKYQSGEVIELNDVVNYTGLGIGVVEESLSRIRYLQRKCDVPTVGLWFNFLTSGACC